MSEAPSLEGHFTLLYADPEIPCERPFLQPLYGLTADDDPPKLPASQQRWTPAPEDAQRDRCLSSVDPWNAVEHGGGSSVRGGMPTAERGRDQQLSSTSVPVASWRARKVDHANLQLYLDMEADVVGPQPLFGGAALGPANGGSARMAGGNGAGATDAATSSPVSTPSPYLFASDGTPLLSHIVNPEALRQLQAARTAYPAPRPRSGHLLLSCRTRGSLILYGGFGETLYNDVWEYDVATGRWTVLFCGSIAGDDTEASQPPYRNSGRDEQIQRRDASDSEDSSRDTDSVRTVSSSVFLSSSDSDFSGEMSETDDVDTASTTSEEGVKEGDAENSRADTARPRRQPDNQPPPAYGQAGALYTNSKGDTCMIVLGGISFGDHCCRGIFSFNLRKRTWRRIETTLPTLETWGGTAQLLYAPSHNAKDPLKREEDEEEVVVLFGGVAEDRQVVQPATNLFHFTHRLTGTEVAAHSDLYLRSIAYSEVEQARVRRRVLTWDSRGNSNEEEAVTEQRCRAWREAHPHRLARWRQRALRKMVGKYWAEYLPSPEGPPGRRRATSAAYRRHFMYIFSGRDDYYFYNDLWCFNLLTRTWVQVRDGVPSHWYHGFLDEPRDLTYGALIKKRVEQIRAEVREAAKTKLFLRSEHGNISSVVLAQELHIALYASSANSSARARTGACMVLDVQRDCLYVYGGFTYMDQQYLTFYDLHAYYIREHVWRRVILAKERRWDPILDGANDMVTIADALEDARPYARHASAPESSGVVVRQPTGLALPLTLMAYAIRHLQHRAPAEPPASSGDATTVTWERSTPRCLPVAPRGMRCGKDLSHREVHYFHLPTIVPEARTMASLAADPLHPGLRFFLHGGRVEEYSRGDLFELRVYPTRVLDVEYTKFQRAGREASLIRRSAGSTEDSSSSSSAHIGLLLSESDLFILSSAMPQTASATAPPALWAPTPGAAGLTAQKALLLKLRSRRGLQRQMLSAARDDLERQQDLPAANCGCGALDSAALLTLRRAALRWIRDRMAMTEAECLQLADSHQRMAAPTVSQRQRDPDEGHVIGRSAPLATAAPTPLPHRVEHHPPQRWVPFMEGLVHRIFTSKSLCDSEPARETAAGKGGCSGDRMYGGQCERPPSSVSGSAEPERRRDEGSMATQSVRGVVLGTSSSAPRIALPPSPRVDLLHRRPERIPDIEAALASASMLVSDAALTLVSGAASMPSLALTAEQPPQQLSSLSSSASADSSIVVSIGDGRVRSPRMISRSASMLSGEGHRAKSPRRYRDHPLLRSLFHQEPFYKAGYPSESAL